VLGKERLISTLVIFAALGWI